MAGVVAGNVELLVVTSGIIMLHILEIISMIVRLVQAFVHKQHGEICVNMSKWEKAAFMEKMGWLIPILAAQTWHVKFTFGQHILVGGMTLRSHHKIYCHMLI